MKSWTWRCVPGLRALAGPLVAAGLALLPSTTAAAHQANWWLGRVVAVSDGDTLRVQDETGRLVVIRVEGVDAPERRQCGGAAARDVLTAWVLRRHVVIEPRKTDRYGRTVARVLRSGTDIGLSLVAAGHAWHYAAFAHEQPALERQAYAGAQAQAREGGTGLWACPDLMPPWEFRRRPSGAARSSSRAAPV